MSNVSLGATVKQGSPDIMAFTGSTGGGYVHAKPGTTIGVGADGKTLELQGQNMAGYIETKSGRTIGDALRVNNAGPVTDEKR